MRGIWFEEYERLWNETEGEPDAERVHEAVTERVAKAVDRQRDRDKYGEHC